MINKESLYIFHIFLFNFSFRGTISQVLVWPRVLEYYEVREIAEYCACPRDYSVVATMDRVELHGLAGYRVDPECLAACEI